MAKHAFERAAEQRGVTIKHYHADNGRFSDNAFIQDCQTNRQILSYCGVNARFQNGIAERRIRDLQERTRNSMLYAMNKWRKMVIINLWPYAMRHANDVANATPRKGQDLSPLEMFSGVEIAPKLRHFMRSGAQHMSWTTRYRAGKGHPNGRSAHGSVYILGLLLITHAPSPWYLILEQATSLLNFMSSSTSFSRQFKLKRLISTLLTLSGSISVVSRRRKGPPTPQPREDSTASWHREGERSQREAHAKETRRTTNLWIINKIPHYLRPTMRMHSKRRMRNPQSPRRPFPYSCRKRR